MSASASTLRRVLGIGVVLSCLTACAARKPAPELVAELGQADALMREGCHACLEEALRIYERLGAARPPVPRAARRAVEAAILLVVRARELGLPWEEPLARAQRLAAAFASETPEPPRPDAAPPISIDVYLAALPLIVGETSGDPSERREQRNRDRIALWPFNATNPPLARATLVGAPASDVVAPYLALAVDCEDARARTKIDKAALLSRLDVPLIRFRLAMCGLAPEVFTNLRATNARWVDTLFFEGRLHMSRYPSPDIGEAAEHFAAAHVAFPTSLAITLALAQARNALSEYEPALAFFDAVVGREPTHREALLGKVMALSYLNRYYDAITTATRMIDLGTYFIGDAYYWRAWNRYNVHQLDPAWDDVERATKQLVNTAVYTLAGFIAYARHERETAIARFVEAYRLDRTNCEAVFSEGSVHVDLESWSNSGARFATAIGCYESAAAQARRELGAAEKAEIAPEQRAKRMATAQRQIDTAVHRRAQSAFNAASSFARLGQKAEAATYVGIAAEHPLLKDKADALRAAIDKLPL